jgi:C-terminal peptidase prc
LLPGIRLLLIEGHSVNELQATEADVLLSGPIGSKVHLTVESAAKREISEHVLERAARPPREMRFSKLNGGVGYVAVDEFDRGVGRRLDRAISKLGSVNSLILDLRGNPGGLIAEAAAIADRLVRSGFLVTLEGRKESSRQHFKAEEADGKIERPLAVLIDRHSASASELLTGALVANDRAVVVGERSYGKGSIQNVIEVEGGMLIVTSGRFFLGPGFPVQRVGITPDLEIREARLETNQFELSDRPEGDREGELPRTLDPGPLAKVEPPKWSMLALARGDEASVEEADPVLRVAARLLRKCGAAKRSKMLTCAAAEEPRWAEEESELVRKEERSALHWESSGAGVSETSLTAKLSIAQPKLLAGQQVELRLRIENRGAKAVDGVTAHFESESAWLQRIEVPIGSIPPATASETVQKLTIPALAPRFATRILAVVHAGDAERARSSADVVVDEPPVSQLGLRAALDDTGGTNDGAVSPNEPVQICATLKNLGADSARPSVVSLDLRASPLSGVAETYRKIDELGPGAEAKACFAGTGRSDLVDGQGTVWVRYGEWNGRVLGWQAVVLPTRKESGARGDRAASAPEWGLDLTVETSPLLATAAEGEVKATALSQGGEVRDVAVYVRGKKHCYAPAPTGGHSFSASCRVPLEPGSNAVVVLARSRGGIERTQQSIFYRPGAN